MQIAYVLLVRNKDLMIPQSKWHLRKNHVSQSCHMCIPNHWDQSSWCQEPLASRNNTWVFIFALAIPWMPEMTCTPDLCPQNKQTNKQENKQTNKNRPWTKSRLLLSLLSLLDTTSSVTYLLSLPLSNSAFTSCWFTHDFHPVYGQGHA